MRHFQINGKVRKIHLYYYTKSAQLDGFKFYDANGNIIYKSAWKWGLPWFKTSKHEIMLAEGERIIGF